MLVTRTFGDFMCLISHIFCPPTVTTKQVRQAHPLPYSSSDRWIVDAKGGHVPVIGINWPGHVDAMIPEGLQYSSIANIVQKITDTGFNTVRLTFAVEMVDDILDNGGDVTLKDSLNRALGATNGTIVLNKILKNNPQFTASTTRLQVFDAVACALSNCNIDVHLDNHVSKAMFCCSLTDGNSWFGDTYFDTTKWIRALAYMANHGKANWSRFSSMGLRNELRPSFTGAPGLQPLTWSTWKTYMTAAASAIHGANPNVLIYFSGLLSDFNIEPAVAGSTLLDLGFHFAINDYEFKNKFVFEMHEYDESINPCGILEATLLAFGFDATTTDGPNRKPLVISEWGYEQDDAAGSYSGEFATCLKSFMQQRTLGWMIWTLGGSYYIRTGVQDSDESYGLLTHDWSSYRGDASLKALKAAIEATYVAYGE